MADNTETPAFDNFNIQDTMNLGAGSQELLKDLLGPETAGGDPDDLKPIINEVNEEEELKNPNNKLDKTTIKPANEVPKSTASISDFLNTGKEEEEEEEEVEDKGLPKKQSGVSKEEEEEEGGEGEEQNTSQFNSLAKDLFSLGVFTTPEGGEEEEITTPEQFLERFNSEKQRGSIEMVNNFIGQFGEDYQNAFQAIFVKGANPKEYFNTFSSIEDFSNLDMTKEENQKAVLREVLTDQGFEPDDVDAEIERLASYGDLESVSARHQKVLVKKQASKLEELEQKSERELRAKTAIRNEYINNVQTIIKDKLKDKVFDGIPINPKLAGELHDFLLVDKYKTPSGETLTDFDRTILDLKRPENHATKVKIGLLLKILEKDPTLSTIQKTGVTNSTNTIFKEITRQNNKPAPGQQKEAATRWFK